MTTPIGTPEISRLSMNQAAVCKASNSARPQWRRWVAGYLLAWCGLLIITYEVLDLPPYEDQAVGLWAEADYLVESGFNYYALRYDEPHYQDEIAGSRSYMISVLPTLVALLLVASPTVQFAIVISHVAAAAFGAMTVVLMFYVLRGLVGNLGAAMASLALLSTPLFLTQIRLVGMDVPVAAFGLLAAIMVWRKRFVAAAGVSTVAFFMKASGGLVTMATITYLAGLLLLMPGDEDPRWRKTCWRGLLANVAALLAQTLIVAWGDTSVSILWGTDWPRAWSLPYAIYWCPDVAAVLFVCAALSLVGVVQYLAASRLWDGAGIIGRARRLLYHGMRRHDVFTLCWIVVVGMLMSSSLYMGIVRYFTPAIPFLFLLLGIVLFSQPRWKRWAATLTLLFIAFNVVNINGDLYPDIEWAAAEDFAKNPAYHARACPFTERSREYLADHLSNIAAARRIEEQYADHPILAPLPQQFYLTKPRLGYVAQPLKAFAISSLPRTIDHFHEAMGTAVDDGGEFKEPVFVWQGRSRILLPPPDRDDEIIYQDDLSPELIIYHKHLRSLAAFGRDEQTEWLLQRTWGQPWLAVRAYARARWLSRQGRIEQALAETAEALRLEPDNQQLHAVRRWMRLRRVADLKEAGQIERAFVEMQQWLDHEPANDDLRRLYEDAVVTHTAALVEAGNFAEACAVAADSLQTRPTSLRLQQLFVSAVDRSKDALVAEGQIDQAVQLVQEARRRRPDDPQLAESEQEVIRRRDEELEIAARFPVLHESSTAARDPSDLAALDRRLVAWIVHFTDTRASALALTLADAELPSDGPMPSDESSAATAYRRGVVACEDGDLAAATDALTAALREGLPLPSAALTHVVRAVIMIEQGRVHDAERDLREALDRSPDFAEARYHLAIVLLQSGRTAEATEELNEALRLAPGHAAAQHHLQTARSRLDQREQEKARELSGTF